ncbi:uncharacterized protein [Triticum aestivum]|uniref:uncharacterized protein isoform X1 n=1 Tax=Triticum aestivum TaxID=4565 RepID=UPI001D01F1DE|nr:uncharacterized protein LOC123133122 isoform X1 [Triticum aestivum]
MPAPSAPSSSYAAALALLSLRSPSRLLAAITAKEPELGGDGSEGSVGAGSGSGGAAAVSTRREPARSAPRASQVPPLPPPATFHDKQSKELRLPLLLPHPHWRRRRGENSPPTGALAYRWRSPSAISRLDGAVPPRRRVPVAAAPFGPARLPSGLRQGASLSPILWVAWDVACRPEASLPFAASGGEEGTWRGRRPRRRCTSCGRPRWWRTCRGGGCGRPRRAGVANGGTSNLSRRATPSSAGASWAMPTTAAARSTPSTPPSASII